MYNSAKYLFLRVSKKFVKHFSKNGIFFIDSTGLQEVLKASLFIYIW